jgi:ankyrin repeat protein
MDVIKLINNDKWNEALEQAKSDPFVEIMNKKNLFHMACIRGNEKIIKFYLSLDSPHIFKSDENGNTGSHLLAINGWDSILLDTVKSAPHFLTLKNDEDKIIINYLIDRITVLKNIIALMEKYDYYDYINDVRDDNRTFLIDLIDSIDDDNIDDNKFELLLEEKFNWSEPKDNPPLIHIIDKNKINLCLKLLDELEKSNVDVDVDINIVSTFYISPLIIAVINNKYDVIKKLIRLDADVNYSGKQDSTIPLNIALKNRNIKLVTLLLNSKRIDFDKTDELLNTPIYYLIHMIMTNDDDYNSSNSKLKEIFVKFVKESNLLNKNFNNTTPLHLLAKFNLWKDVKDILLDKKLDISTLDRDGQTTLSYLDSDQTNDFIKLIEEKREKDPLIINPKEKINLPSVNNGEYGLFNADTIHNIIYLIYILNKYDNAVIPFQCDLNEKKIWEKQFIYNSDPATEMISLSIKTHHKYFYSFLPCILYWRDKNIYYKTKDLVFYIKRSLNIKNKRFVILKFSLMPQIGTMHANMVIYDKEKNVVMRFEPYGDWEILDSYSLDKMIGKLFQKATGNNKIKYLRPGDYLKNPKFQTASFGDIKKNLGDPVGYCLAWCYWFLELKLQNPDTNEKVLVETALENIIINGEKEDDNPLLSYIRGYGRKLNEGKDKILKEIGVSDYELYGLTYTSEKLNKIKHRINQEVQKILA